LLSLLSRVLPNQAAQLAWLLTRRTRPRRTQRRFGTEVARHDIGGDEVILYRLAPPRRACRVLLVHGWNAAAIDWLPLAMALHQRGFDVFAVDLPGHGAARGRVSSLPRFVRALEQIETLHGPFEVWIGHSMGASAALAAHARGAQARRLVLVAGLASPAKALRAFARALGLAPSAINAYLARIERSEGMRLTSLESAVNASRVLSSTLLVHDDDDRVIPQTESESLVAHFRSAALLRTRGLGHRRVLDDASIIEAISDFACGEVDVAATAYHRGAVRGDIAQGVAAAGANA
jgi:pimeloyl-ACP methyl ester carboxylesterase